MTIPVGKWSMAAGELAPGLWGHVDYAKYQLGLGTCRNAFISYRGGAYSRPGTRFVGYSRQTTNGSMPPRLVPFQFNLNQGFALEFGNFYMRVVSQGGLVLNPSVAITGISQANPAVITAPGHGFANGDWAVPSGVVGMTEVNNQAYVVHGVTTNTFQIFDVFGNPINSTAFSAYVSGGIVSTIFTLTTPWAEADLQWLKFTQSADVMSICCWNQQTNAALNATGTIAFTVNPSNGDTITLNGLVWTFVTGVPAAHQTQIQGSLAATLTHLATDLTASTSVLINVATYFATTTQLDIAFKASGTVGNTYTLMASAATPSGPALFGGNISYPAYDLERIADNIWTLTQFSAASSVSPPASVTAIATNTHTNAMTAPATDYQMVVTTVNNLTGEESQASNIADVPNSVDISVISGSIKVSWAAEPGNVSYNIYQAPPAITAGVAANGVPPGSLTGFVGSSFGNEFTITNIVPDFNQVPPLHLDPFQPGQILFVNITSGGSGLTNVTAVITSLQGTGFIGFAVIVNGVLQAFVVQNPGKLYRPGDPIAFNGIGFATGAITFSVNPSNGDTITLNGVVWTFVTSGATGNQTNIQSSLSATMLQLATDLTASTNVSLTVASYTAEPLPVATGITIEFNTAGPAGNAYTLAASVATPSGPHLTGGSGSGAISGTLEVGPETGTFPSVPAYFQQRRFYASTPNQPDTYFGSQPGAFNNFDQRIPVIDSDAIQGTPWAVQVNGIQQLVPMPGGLIAGTGRGVWQLGGAGSSPTNPQPITPINQQAEAQAFNGFSAYMPAIPIYWNIVFLQALGSIFRDLNYNIYAGIYTSVDLTYLSSHLFTGFQMRESAWCEEPSKLIWVTREDGILLSLTYFKEQDVVAWTRHDTQGLTWSVCSVVEPPIDALYLATQRQIGGGNNAYFIERQDNRTWNGVETTWCVDCGLSLNQPTPAASLTVAMIDGLGAITGFTDFQGGNNYSAGSTAMISDPTGIGAVVTVAVVAGVLQPPVIVDAGTGYTDPKAIFTDPNGIGTGAIGTPTIGNPTALTASAPAFTTVGQVVRGASGIAVITAVTDTQHATANVIQPFVQTQAGQTFIVIQPGDWTLTTPVSTVLAPHLAGGMVTGIADGQVIPPTLVAGDGTIMLATPASQITVGLPFQVQIQTLRPESGQPTTQGQRKTIGGVTLRVEQSLGFEVGTNQPDASAQSPIVFAPLWSGMIPVPPPGKPIGLPPYQSMVTPLFTDDVRVPQVSGWDKHGQVAIQQNQPLPLQVLAVITEFLEADTPDISVSARPPGSVAPGKTPFPY